MDLPYTWSDDGNGVHQPSWNSSYQYCSSNSITLNTHNRYEESEVNGDSCQNFKVSWAEPPVEIHEECTTDIDLPPLVWHGYDIPPKLLSVCNTGRTITINGQWTNGKPYIEGGPLNGKYIFSQIHFHCPSEHEIDGRRYPLEMHVVHYKNSYLTQERAMHEKDGTLVLVYLFQVVESGETVLSEITRICSCLLNANARMEIKKIPLCNLVKPFFCNYYVYWGSVMMKKNSYILQWIINCCQSHVTKQEVDTLLGVMSSCVLGANKGPKMKPHNSIIYRVGENYDTNGLKKTGNTDTSTSMHFDIVIEAEPGLDNKQTLCLHTSNYPCCNNCTPHSASCPTQVISSKCSAHSTETRCATHGTADSVIFGVQNASPSQTQNVCGVCGGLEVEITIPKHVCKCKDKLPKVCSSCGGSKSGISWCKRKWKQCASKCSLWSKTSSCSNTDTSCKKCTKKRKPRKKKYCSKKSSDTSCSEKCSEPEVCPKKKPAPRCQSPMRAQTPPPEREPKVRIEIKRNSSEPCEEDFEEPCAKPSPPPCSDPCPTKSPEPCKTPCRTKSPEPCKTPCRSKSPEPCKTPCRAKSPEPCKTPCRTKSPEPCKTPCSESPPDLCPKPSPVSCSPSCTTSCEKESCSKPPSETCISTSYSTPNGSATDICSKKKKKAKKEKKEKKKKPKCLTKETSMTSVKKVEKTKTELTDVCDQASKKSIRKETKTSLLRKNNDSKDVCNTGKKGKSGTKSKEKVNASEKSSEKCDKKTKNVKKKKKDEEEIDEITTLFVKMPENIFPPCTKSSLSYSEVGLNEKKDTDDEEDPKTAKRLEQEYIVNTLTTSGLKLPDYKINSTSKELYLQMKHSFQSGKSHSTSVSQEFQVSIVCDSNILQEYKGLFQPQEISLGSFEKLQLIPKYQEPDDLSVRLQECVIKKPSVDKFCIDSKFLLKGLNTRDVLPSIKKKTLKNLNEKVFDIFDAETQYSKEKIEISKKAPLDLTCRSVQTDETCLPMTDKIKRIFCKKLDLKSQNVQTDPQDEQKKKNSKDLVKCKTRILKTTSEPEFLTATKKYRQNPFINLMEAKICKSANANSHKLAEKLECKIKLIKNPQTSSENTEVGSSSMIVQKKDVDKSNLEVAQRNTVYFMYDRIEKDPLTGKKIFMGRFRTKDDLKILKEHKITSKTDSLKSFGSRSTTEKGSSTSSRVLNIEKLNDFPEKKDLGPEHQILPQETKDEVSAHTFMPKCLDLTQFKVQNPNLVPDVVKWFQDDGENFDLLADIIGFEKKGRSKIFGPTQTSDSIFESDYSVEYKTRSGGLGNPMYEDKGTMCSSGSLIFQNMENSMALRSLDSDAVIIVPVEVESWSKIEVMLIERSDDEGAIKHSKKYIPLI